MELKITISDKKGIMKAFQKAPAVAQREFNASLERTAATVVNYAQHNAPSKNGDLRRSISYRRTATGFLVGVGAKYGIYVDQGTKAHTIYPRKAKVLAFQKDGKWVFAKKINHPGTKATHFFTDAVEDGQTYANAEMKRAVAKVIKYITG